MSVIPHAYNKELIRVGISEESLDISKLIKS